MTEPWPEALVEKVAEAIQRRLPNMLRSAAQEAAVIALDASGLREAQQERDTYRRDWARATNNWADLKLQYEKLEVERDAALAREQALRDILLAERDAALDRSRKLESALADVDT